MGFHSLGLRGWSHIPALLPERVSEWSEQLFSCLQGSFQLYYLLLSVHLLRVYMWEMLVVPMTCRYFPQINHVFSKRFCISFWAVFPFSFDEIHWDNFFLHKWVFLVWTLSIPMVPKKILSSISFLKYLLVVLHFDSQSICSFICR